MNTLSLLLTALTTSWIVLGTGSVFKLTRAGRDSDTGETLLPVSVLKPLCGVDAGLSENLESFFLQDHPSYELLLGVEREDDPALPVVRQLIARHPHVRARVIVHAPPRGQNPKVRNLRGILPHASHDLVLISDSNVRAPVDYLRRTVRVFQAHPDNGLVTNLLVGAVAGGGTSTLGADLECIQLAGFCAGGAALPTALGDAAVIGKSMLFSRAVFESLGGFARVADVLAEDYVMGKMFQHGGFRVAVAPTVLENVMGRLSIKGFFDRQLRWSMLRARLRPATFLLEPLCSPLAMLPIAWAWMGVWAVAWMMALFVVRDALPWARFSGARALYKPLVLSVIRDAFALAIWCATPFKHHACWRGHRVRVGAGTLLFSEEG